MLAQEIITRKRDGEPLSKDAIEGFVTGVTDRSWSDAQVAALAMAVAIKGLSADETVALALAMRDSGRSLVWDLPGPVLDKHSTGGIGDKVSLVLAPLLAACGAYVPMLSGRGLGHTGGTLDKLEAIPGYRTDISIDELEQFVRDAGCAIVGANAELAPADRRLYAIRDTTATVENVGLITASILSKKLAGGADALVMDIKTGSGAFLPSLAAARELANALVEAGEGAGLTTRAVLTDMSQCLGHNAGNALEVAEAVQMLRGEETEARFEAVVRRLAGELLVLGNLVKDAQEADDRLDLAFKSGAAAERFQKMVGVLGGPKDFIDNADRYLAKAPVINPVISADEGTIAAIDARALGWTIVELGGGRRQAGDAVDPAVGLSQVAGLGQPVSRSKPLAYLHAKDETSFQKAADRLRKAFHVSAEPPPETPLFRDLSGDERRRDWPETGETRPVSRRPNRRRSR
ncbi:MAG: thymidine phosphorylase [Geminicoccaceae bacterium]